MNKISVYQNRQISTWLGNEEKKEKKRSNRKSGVPSYIKEEVWRSQNGDKLDGWCYLCHGSLSYCDCEISHKIARSKGGSNAVKNLCCMHRRCNASVGTNSVLEYKRKYYPHLMNREGLISGKSDRKED